MIVLLSPAKNLKSDIPPAANGTTPELIEDAGYLVNKLRKCSPKKLSQMMNISAALGELNYERYQAWDYPFPVKKAFPAIHLFAGDVYRGLNAAEFDNADMDFAQVHLRILSGLYGALRPMDSMMPYRLEMGTRWSITPGKKNLYNYWDNRITDSVGQALAATSSKLLVDLASAEYSKSVQKDKLDAELITPVFRDLKNGVYKSIMTYAKLARGYMCSYIVKNRIEDKEALKGFDLHGYRWNADLSNENEFVFTRDQVA